jgi:hypothetical protein
MMERPCFTLGRTAAEAFIVPLQRPHISAFT